MVVVGPEFNNIQRYSPLVDDAMDERRSHHQLSPFCYFGAVPDLEATVSNIRNGIRHRAAIPLDMIKTLFTLREPRFPSTLSIQTAGTSGCQVGQKQRAPSD